LRHRGRWWRAVGLSTAGKPATLTAVNSTALLNDGRVLLIGSGGAELYDPVSGIFSPVANWPGQDDSPFDATTSLYWYPVVLAGGEVLLAPYDSLSGCAIYDPATGTFNLTRAIAGWQLPPATTLLLNGAVLFTGGSDGLGNVNWAKLYDPAAGRFASNGSMGTSTALSARRATIEWQRNRKAISGVEVNCGYRFIEKSL